MIFLWPAVCATIPHHDAMIAQLCVQHPHSETQGWSSTWAGGTVNHQRGRAGVRILILMITVLNLINIVVFFTWIENLKNLILKIWTRYTTPQLGSYQRVADLKKTWWGFRIIKILRWSPFRIKSPIVLAIQAFHVYLPSLLGPHRAGQYDVCGKRSSSYLWIIFASKPSSSSSSSS